MMVARVENDNYKLNPSQLGYALSKSAPASFLHFVISGAILPFSITNEW